MIVPIEGLPPGILGFRASGEASFEDLAAMMTEVMAGAGGPKVGVVIDHEPGYDFEGEASQALQVDIRRDGARRVRKLAFLHDVDRPAQAESFESATGVPTRCFHPRDRLGDALRWLAD